jgi:hypothetical protein
LDGTVGVLMCDDVADLVNLPFHTKKSKVKRIVTMR